MRHRWKRRRTAETENGLNKVAKILPIELYFNYMFYRNGLIEIVHDINLLRNRLMLRPWTFLQALELSKTKNDYFHLFFSCSEIRQNMSWFRNLWRLRQPKSWVTLWTVQYILVHFTIDGEISNWWSEIKVDWLVT